VARPGERVTVDRLQYFRLFEEASKRTQVGLVVAAQASAFVAPEVTSADNDETETLGGNPLLPPRVVQLTLFAPVDTTDGQPIGFVEVRHGLVVLTLPVLHDETVLWVVRVDRQANAATAPARIAK